MTTPAVSEEMKKFLGLVEVEPGCYASTDEDFAPMPGKDDLTPPPEPAPAPEPTPAPVATAVPMPDPDQVYRAARLKAEMDVLVRQATPPPAAPQTAEEQEAQRWLAVNAAKLGFVHRGELAQRDLAAQVDNETTAARQWLDQKYTEPASRAQAERVLLPVLVRGRVTTGQTFDVIHNVIGQGLKTDGRLYGLNVTPSAPNPTPASSRSAPSPAAPAAPKPSEAPTELSAHAAATLGLGPGPFSKSSRADGKPLDIETLRTMGLADGPFNG